MSIKSVHLTNYYHKHSGGISTSYNNLLAAAERHRRFVSLIVPGESESVEQINDFAKIYYVPANYSPVFDKRYRMIKPWQYMMRDSTIRSIMMAEAPDMVEVCDKYSLSMFGAMIGRGKFNQLGRPMTVHFSCERMDDNVASYLAGGKLGKWFSRRVIGNYILPSFDFHIANSHYTAQEFFDSIDPEKNPRRSGRFLDWCWRTFRSPSVPVEERVFVCPRGVDAEFYSPERRSVEIRKRIVEATGIPDNAVVLLYAGRLSPEKNIGLLADLMKVLANNETRDYRLLVAGDGPLADWLKDEAERRMPGRIVMLGHLDKDALADHYANVDIFVHPNPKEPFGIAPLEAMASGAAVVAPSSGGILSYATAHNSWLVEPNADSFAEAVRQIANDDETRAKKAANARKTALENTREIATDRLFETYDRLYEDFISRREMFTKTPS